MLSRSLGGFKIENFWKKMAMSFLAGVCKIAENNECSTGLKRILGFLGKLLWFPNTLCIKDGIRREKNIEILKTEEPERKIVGIQCILLKKKKNETKWWLRFILHWNVMETVNKSIEWP